MIACFWLWIWIWIFRRKGGGFRIGLNRWRAEGGEGRTTKIVGSEGGLVYPRCPSDCLFVCVLCVL